MLTLPLMSAALAAFDSTTLFLIVLVAFLAGVGITAIGPGGIFITIALSMTPLPPALIAGTGSATNVVAGTIGSGMYAQSGELRSESGKRLTIVLSIFSVAGALAGQLLNGHVS